MPHRVKVSDLFEALSQRLQLSWVAGRSGSEKAIISDGIDSGTGIIAGPLNYIHPNRVQVIGQAEKSYIEGLGPHGRKRSIGSSAGTRARTSA